MDLVNERKVKWNSKEPKKMFRNRMFATLSDLVQEERYLDNSLTAESDRHFVEKPGHGISARAARNPCIWGCQYRARLSTLAESPGPAGSHLLTS